MRYFVYLKVLLVIFLLVTSCPLLVTNIYAEEDEFVITTYYPSPYGSYNEMRVNKIVIGELDSSVTPAPDTAGLLRFKGLGFEPNQTNDKKPGTIYYNSTENKFKYYDGTTWKALGYTQACIGDLCCPLGTDCYKTGPESDTSCDDSACKVGGTKVYGGVQTRSDGSVDCWSPSCAQVGPCGCMTCMPRAWNDNTNCIIRP